MIGHAVRSKISIFDDSENLYYIHTDYLGSIMALSDKSGNKIEEYFYDACLSAGMYMKAEGLRKNPVNWSEDDMRTDLIVDRGYTSHEHWDYFDLINMNGRVYDPQLGRFLSPDPVFQPPDYSQNFNKYSYVLNNPFKYTDPSGYNPAPIEMDINRIAAGNIGGRRFDFSGANAQANAYFASNYSYDATSVTGYRNGLGQEVSFGEVFNNYIAPNITSVGSLHAAAGINIDGHFSEITVYNAEGTLTTVMRLPGQISLNEAGWYNLFQTQKPQNNVGRHSNIDDLWNISVGGTGTFAAVRSEGMHNSLYWVQKNGKVTLTRNIGSNYLLQRSNRIVGETLKSSKMLAKSITKANIFYTSVDYVGTAVYEQRLPTFGEGMDLFFTSVAAIPGAGWAVSGGYWVISAGSYAFTGKWMSEHMDNWVQ